MRQIVSLSILGTLIVLLCPSRELRAVDPCQKCPCKQVKAWMLAGVGESTIFGMRAPDKNEPGAHIAVEHSPTITSGLTLTQIYSSTCGDPVSTKTGENYKIYFYNTGTAQCTGAPNENNVEVTGWDMATRIQATGNSLDQRHCKKE